MDSQFVLELVGEYGYLALFFCLWLGIVGMPIPDEVVVMTGGVVSSIGILHTVPSLVITYLGVISGLMIGYWLGRTLGASVLERILKKKKFEAPIERSQQLLHKYGSFALCMSYFLPIVRHLVPYLVGMNRMSFKTYALFSFTTGFVWTNLFFWLGYQFGQSLESEIVLIQQVGKYIVGSAVVVYMVYLITKRWRPVTEKGLE